MKALVATGTGNATVLDVENYPVRDTYIKIKVHAIALNPTDYKHVFHYTKGGEIVGCDVAGEVVAIGSKVTSQVQIGERIAGLTHGCNSYSPRDGGFAEYAEIKDGIFTHLHPAWTWAQGATLPGGVTTAAQGLFQALNLPLPLSPNPSPVPVLIYGGSTATSCLAIQFAKLAGCHPIITTASPNQFERLKRLGVDVCYDYHVTDVGKKIHDDTNGQLLHAFDVISNEGSMKICADALASGPRDGIKPKCTLLLPGKIFPRDDVEVGLTSGYSVLGETSIKYGNLVEGEPEHYEFGRMFWALIDRLIREEKLVTHDVEVRDGGLEGVVSGLRDLELGKVKGVKLVYNL